MPLSRERKVEYFGKMKALLDSYTKVFIVQVDNVGSKQMQQTRAAMRKDAEVQAFKSF
jgi:large subunit ribosomal protein LP0